MDDLYDNLDNFNEETTIEELHTENKELKCKLKEYASTLEELQKDFDKLNLEYKNLELNYSSLLKTAKAEIERKTLIISNLNKEKDMMVIKSLQNKNAGFTKSRAYDNPMLAQNYNQGRDVKSDGSNKIKEIEDNIKPSPPIEKYIRKEQDNLTLKETTASPQTDIRSKLINMANTGLKQGDPRIKNGDVKENMLQSKKENDTLKSRALIRNRRKSMPAVSMEIDNFNMDDHDDLARAANINFRENTDRKHIDSKFSSRQSSKISDTSSLEDRNSGFHEPSDTHKSRYSRHDDNKIDRYRVRDKSSHRYRRQSPERYKRGHKEFHDNTYHRVEYDRHRAKERVLESPPKDKYHRRTSPERHQRNYERNHPHERLQHRSQERYPMKHKIQHNYDELDSKRMKVEPNYKQHEECRLQGKREFMEKKYSTETFDIQFSSCESPDYSHPDVSTHQIKEIKLTATSKLDDPRISNPKYVLKTNNGKVALSTIEGRNVKIVPVNKIAWGIIPVSMPEALVRRPSLENVQSVNEICPHDIENPVANISTESGEILDIDSQNVPETISNRSKISKINTKEIPVVKCDDTKNIENSLQKINSYKIPKIKKMGNGTPSCRKIKESNQLLKSEHVNTVCKSKSSEIAIQNIDKSKQFMKPAKEKTVPDENKQDSFLIQSNNELPNLDSSDLYNEHRYVTAKDVVEGDLELSDDNFDNNEQSNQITTVACTQLEKKKKDNDQSSKSNPKQSTHSSERVESCQNKTIDNAKKTKSKKKSKHKETKEELISKDFAQVSEKATRKKEKEQGIKTAHIKTKFSELFDDSSSLISPEDLGLATVPVVPATQLPEKCVPFFEDALDADDLNAMKKTNGSIPLEKSQVQASEECKQSSDTTNITKIAIANTTSQEPMDRAIDIMQPAISEEVTENIYKNLEPDVPEKEKDIVKTIIISTGVQPDIVNERDKQDISVQPQIEVESEKQNHAHKTGPLISIASQELALTALATSTPHKMCMSSVDKCNIEAKLPNASCNSVVNESGGASIENSAALDNSDSNTLDSQANGADVPDVRIFVRRRRKIIKK